MILVKKSRAWLAWLTTVVTVTLAADAGEPASKDGVGHPQTAALMAVAQGRSQADLFGDRAQGWPLRPAAVISFNNDGLPRIESTVAAADAKPGSDVAIMLYGDDAGERYAVAEQGDNGSRTWAATSAIVGAGRAVVSEGPCLATAAADLPLALLAQLTSGETPRARGALETPFAGAVFLDGRLQIRRAPDADATVPVTGAILSAGRTVLDFRLPAGIRELAWEELCQDLPDLREGLSAGVYQIELRGDVGVERIRFRILEQEDCDVLLTRSRAIGRLVGTDCDPLVAQVAVDAFLRHDPPLLVDARRVIASLPAESRTDHLRETARRIDDRLATSDPAGGTRFVFPTSAAVAGAAETDDRIAEIRGHVAAGRWPEAQALWQTLAAAEDRRLAGIAILSRAVFLSQAANLLADDAEAQFRAAWRELAAHGTADDQRRCCINYGNFLLRAAIDEIHNHALRLATGGSLSLTRAALRLRDAIAAFAHAADGADATTMSTVLTGAARAYALLGDLLIAAGSGLDQPAVVELRQAALSAASDLAADALATAPASLHDTRAVAHEVAARIAFRRGETKLAAEEARLALGEYLEAGSLAGTESVYRMLGLLAAASAPEEALRHLRIALEIGDLLRERMLDDAAGVARAGFLSQRSYVTERIVEILVSLQRPREALLAVEHAKARSLTDVLAMQATRAGQPARLAAATARGPLDDWPADVAAVEYFIGVESAWIFSIDRRGTVAVVPVCDASGRRLPSPKLIADVQAFLAGIDTLGPRVGRRLGEQAGAGLPVRFDRSWQDELATLYDRLFPSVIREAVSGAETVVIVPHHILHYVPFAALIVERDDTGPADRMPLPRFLVDESFDLAHAPSLTSWRTLRDRSVPVVTEAGALGIVDFGTRAAPLQGVARDLMNLRDVFGEQLTTVVRDGAATEAAVRALLERPGLVAVCTHGQKIPDAPLAAYLICQRGPEEDGMLTVAEVYGLDVRADLVMLNCCYGGFADRAPLPGDDLFGMQRALLTAGAATVVSGLWDIFDATAPDLMRGFCSRLRAGEGAAAALAGSQRAFLARWRAAEPEVTRFLTHPYYWAVFTVAGDDRTTGAAHAERFLSVPLPGGSPPPNQEKLQ